MTDKNNRKHDSQRALSTFSQPAKNTYIQRRITSEGGHGHKREASHPSRQDTASDSSGKANDDRDAKRRHIATSASRALRDPSAPATLTRQSVEVVGVHSENHGAERSVAAPSQARDEVATDALWSPSMQLREPATLGLDVSHSKTSCNAHNEYLNALHETFVTTLRGQTPLSPRTKKSYQYFPDPDSDGHNGGDKNDLSGDSDIELDASKSRNAGTVRQPLDLNRSAGPLIKWLTSSNEAITDSQQESVRRTQRDRRPLQQGISSLPRIENTPSGKPYGEIIRKPSF